MTLDATAAGIDLRIVWFDNDMLELRVIASNGIFVGETTFYESFECPTNFARSIAGFPSTSEEVRTFVMGNTNNDGLLGGVSLKFSNLDKMGHLNLEIFIHGNATEVGELTEFAKLNIPMTPADVDELVYQLEQMKLIVGDGASIEIFR